MHTDTILVIGESLIDIVRRPGCPPQFFPGGSPLNVAIGLGRLGNHPRLATWFADDEYGRLIKDHCAQSGVGISTGSDGAARTSTADASIDDQGHATYVFDIDWRMPPVEDDTPVLVHTGSIGALVAPGGMDVLEFVESTQAFVTFDPNCRPSIMGDPDTVRPHVERYVAASGLVKVSDEDLMWLYPGITTEQEVKAQLRHWLDMGPDAVVLTRGGKGALALMQTCTSADGQSAVNHESTWGNDSDGLYAEVSVPADTSHGLQDTVGAGDSFMAGLIHGIVTRGHPGDALLHNPDTLRAILTESAAISGITVSRAGANPPWLSELQ